MRLVREEWSCHCERHTFSMLFVEHLHPNDKCIHCGTPPLRLHRRWRAEPPAKQ